MPTCGIRELFGGDGQVPCTDTDCSYVTVFNIQKWSSLVTQWVGDLVLSLQQPRSVLAQELPHATDKAKKICKQPK